MEQQNAFATPFVVVGRDVFTHAAETTERGLCSALRDEGSEVSHSKHHVPALPLGGTISDGPVQAACRWGIPVRHRLSSVHGHVLA